MRPLSTRAASKVSETSTRSGWEFSATISRLATPKTPASAEGEKCEVTTGVWTQEGDRRAEGLSALPFRLPGGDFPHWAGSKFSAGIGKRLQHAFRFLEEVERVSQQLHAGVQEDGDFDRRTPRGLLIPESLNGSTKVQNGGV